MTNVYDMTNEERIQAIYNAVPQKPHRNELGGGIYWTCHWIKCNATVTRWDNYCPVCGQKIDWRDI